MEVYFYLLGSLIMMKAGCVLVCFLGDDCDNI